VVHKTALSIEKSHSNLGDTILSQNKLYASLNYNHNYFYLKLMFDLHHYKRNYKEMTWWNRMTNITITILITIISTPRHLQRQMWHQQSHVKSQETMHTPTNVGVYSIKDVLYLFITNFNFKSPPLYTEYVT
jgi:hypothetical protein